MLSGSSRQLCVYLFGAVDGDHLEVHVAIDGPKFLFELARKGGGFN
jgi:hypothetical protein